MSSENLQLIEISQQPIPLCQLLKIANLVSGGGEAKIVISEGYVLLNNEVEYQKRKKVYEHDIVEFNGELIQVVINLNLTKESKQVKNDPINNVSQLQNSNDITQKKSKISKTNKKMNQHSEIKHTSETTVNPLTKRKPISF